MGNLETGNVVDQQSEVSCLTQTKRLKTLKTEEQYEKLLQKLARPFLDNSEKR